MPNPWQADEGWETRLAAVGRSAAAASALGRSLEATLLMLLRCEDIKNKEPHVVLNIFRFQAFSNLGLVTK